MPNKIIIKNGNTPPTNEQLATSELGYDKKGKQLYIGNGEEQPQPIILKASVEEESGTLILSYNN